MGDYVYQDEFSIDSSVEDRRKKGVGDIFMNRAQCLLCEEIITSSNRHDYKTCKCGNFSVDGGSWYCKRTFKQEGTWKDLTIAYNERGSK